MNYKVISLLSVVVKAYAGILVDRMRLVTRDKIGVKQGAVEDALIKITVKQMSEKNVLKEQLLVL